jgi:hypothetical protein
LSEGDLHIDMTRGRIVALYSTSLPHLVFNEYNNAASVGIHLRKPGPYLFQNIGAAEFLKVASTTKLPSPFRRFKYF